MAMDPAIKAEWVAALRSGRYQQGMGSLERRGAYCCLGVLCELGVKRGEVEYREDSFRGLYDDGGEFPSVKFAKRVGLPSVYGTFWMPVGGGECKEFDLSELNDTGQFSFDQIADLIEYFM